QRAVEEAELMAGCEVSSAYVSISGKPHPVPQLAGRGAHPRRQVTHADLAHVLDAAKAVAIPADQRILHAVPRDYVLDGSQEGIRNPIGMTGVRLEVHAHLVISRCRGGGRQHQQVRAEVRAAGGRAAAGRAGVRHAVLTYDERELGVVPVDMGAGTTDIAVFVGGAIAHSASLPIAGDKVTEDIAAHAAHADAARRGHQGQIRLRAGAAGARGVTASRWRERAIARRGGCRWTRWRRRCRRRVTRKSSRWCRRLRRSGFEQRVRAGMVPYRRRREDGGRGRAGRGNVADAGADRHPGSTSADLARWWATPVHATGIGLLR
ncbi:rod shape-determining protein, partial [Thermomonas sp. S9]|nr:rod shape-determining protein [Thermomonas sp. S9]